MDKRHERINVIQSAVIMKKAKVEKENEDERIEKLFRKIVYEEVSRVLKENGLLVINIADVKSFKNLVDEVVVAAEKVGFSILPRWHLNLSSMLTVGHKKEPILVFWKSCL